MRLQREALHPGEGEPPGRDMAWAALASLFIIGGGFGLCWLIITLGS